MNTIFWGRNKFTLAFRVQKVFVLALCACIFIKIDSTVCNLIGFLAVSSFFKQKTFIITVWAYIFESLMINLAIRNDIMRFTESILQKEFILAHLTDIWFNFIYQTIGNVSLIAKIFFHFNVKSNLALQTLKFFWQITRYLIFVTIGDLR